MRVIDHFGHVQESECTGALSQAPTARRRLKRDAALPEAPNHERAKEALEKPQAGEIRSARQARIAAGIMP
jgi:hypothetical protein